ncbi:MAG: PorT family protein [Dysgonamonadaceae bacterium]|jgi:hypothetical protein|nr:PorT family protein [Dysgonamonadaceae bacterium]
MIKKIVFLLFFCSLPVFVFSQWGIRGGLNFSKFSGSSLDYKTGFHIGMTYDIALSKKFYFQPGLSFLSWGTGFSSRDVTIKESHVSIYGLELPLTISFRPKISEKMKLIFDTGLYAKYGLFGNYEYSKTVKGSAFPAYNRFDIGLNLLGVGIEYMQYYINGTCQIGLKDAENDVMSLNQSFRVNLGYQF